MQGAADAAAPDLTLGDLGRLHRMVTRQRDDRRELCARIDVVIGGKRERYPVDRICPLDVEAREFDWRQLLGGKQRRQLAHGQVVFVGHQPLLKVTAGCTSSGIGKLRRRWCERMVRVTAERSSSMRSGFA